MVEAGRIAKVFFVSALVCLLCAGCTKLPETMRSAGLLFRTAEAESTFVVSPLPDDVMEHLNDAILSVSLEAGDVYLDNTGKLQMDVVIYTCDKYDPVDVALLKVGDILVTHEGNVEVTALEHKKDGTVSINGGLEADGLELATDDCGVYEAMASNGCKAWYEAGTETIRVSVDFQGYDRAEPELGEVIFYPGSFLVNEVTNYDFTPCNTTIRVENGQVVELHRISMPKQSDGCQEETIAAEEME